MKKLNSLFKSPLNIFISGNKITKKKTPPTNQKIRKVIFRRKITGPCNTNPHIL